MDTPSNRLDVMKKWGEEERRMGKFINLSEDTLKSLVGVPLSHLEEEIRSFLSRK